MKWFRQSNGGGLTGIDEKCEKPFKPFYKTYRIVAFAMAMGMIYPNPATRKIRRNYIILTYITVTPMTIMVMKDIYQSYLLRDYANITRHFAIIIPFCVVQLKIFLMHYNGTLAKVIIDEIDRDHTLYNDLPESYGTIVQKGIRNNLRGESYWSANVFMCMGIFPVMSITLNLYNFLFKAEPTKYMIHEINNPFSSSPSEVSQSPYFEIMMVYEGYCCVIFTLNFLGYDGFFGVAINHACLKIKLYCKALEDALTECDTDAVHSKIVEVINEQNRVFRLVDAIQGTFNVWLGVILTGTIIHICNCLYQILEGSSVDVRFAIFGIGAVIHIYLPCRYAARVKYMSQEVATLVYCSGWENVHDQAVRKIILFMITRSQVPLTITAFNFVTFDMELFLSILQSTYSMFTLMRS